MRWPLVFAFAQAARARLVLDYYFVTSGEFDVDHFKALTGAIDEREYLLQLGQHGVQCKLTASDLHLFRTEKHDLLFERYACDGAPGVNDSSVLDTLSASAHEKLCKTALLRYFRLPGDSVRNNGQFVHLYDYHKHLTFPYCAADINIPAWSAFWRAILPVRKVRQAAAKIRAAAMTLAQSSSGDGAFVVTHIRDLLDGRPAEELSVDKCVDEIIDLVSRWEAHHAVRAAVIYVVHQKRHRGPAAALQLLTERLVNRGTFVFACQDVVECRDEPLVEKFGGLIDYWLLTTGDYMIGTNSSSFALNAYYQRQVLFPWLDGDVDTLGLHHHPTGKLRGYPRTLRSRAPCCSFFKPIYSGEPLALSDIVTPAQRSERRLH